MELLSQSLCSSSIAGLMNTEQAHLVREVFNLIEHHEHLPVKRLFLGVGKVSVEARSWLINEIRRWFFLRLSLLQQKKHGVIKSPPLVRPEPRAGADG